MSEHKLLKALTLAAALTEPVLASAEPALKTPMGVALGVTQTMAVETTPLNDARIVTMYDPSDDRSRIGWVTCGVTQDGGGGCFGGGILETFTRAGTMLEGAPHVSKPSAQETDISRYVYVVDAGNAQDLAVKLEIFVKKDKINPDFDTVSAKLVREVPLPSLTGGDNATCFIGANGYHVYVGTNLSDHAVRIDKKTYNNIEEIGGFSPPMPVSDITATNKGDVNVTFGGPATPFSGFISFNKDGNLQSDGGGGDIVLNSVNGVWISPPSTGNGAALSLSRSVPQEIHVYENGRPTKSYLKTELIGKNLK